MRPALVGAVMGPMALWMLHGPIGRGEGPAALAIFALAHLAVLGALLALARVVPGLRGRLHRPTLPHVATMAGGALLSAGAVHLIHGGPA
ncbi:MAG: hypothetical protein ACU0BF_11930 [Paracoccaceae bacterium]